MVAKLEVERVIKIGFTMPQLNNIGHFQYGWNEILMDICIFTIWPDLDLSAIIWQILLVMYESASQNTISQNNCQ